MQRKIGNFHKDFYIKQIEKISYHRSYYKILGKHHVADVRHKAFESIPGDISTWSDMQNNLALIPTVKYIMNSLTTIVSYPWKVAV